MYYSVSTRAERGAGGASRRERGAHAYQLSALLSAACYKLATLNTSLATNGLFMSLSNISSLDFLRTYMTCLCSWNTINFFYVESLRIYHWQNHFIGILDAKEKNGTLKMLARFILAKKRFTVLFVFVKRDSFSYMELVTG